mgnify:CR=1 FL=1
MAQGFLVCPQFELFLGCSLFLGEKFHILGFVPKNLFRQFFQEKDMCFPLRHQRKCTPEMRWNLCLPCLRQALNCIRPKKIFPCSISFNPAMIRRSVVFPQPLGPTIEVIVALGIFSEQFFISNFSIFAKTFSIFISIRSPLSLLLFFQSNKMIKN